MRSLENRWIRYGISVLVLTMMCVLLSKELSLLSISNACAIVGIFVLNWALYLTAKSLGFYNIIIFGFKKFMEIWKHKDLTHEGSKVGQYYEFIGNFHPEKNYKEPYIVALGLIVVSLITSMGI